MVSWNLEATPLCCCQSHCWVPAWPFPWINRSNPMGLFDSRGGQEGFGVCGVCWLWDGCCSSSGVTPPCGSSAREGGNAGGKGHGIAAWLSQQWEQFSSPQHQPPRSKMFFCGISCGWTSPVQEPNPRAQGPHVCHHQPHPWPSQRGLFTPSAFGQGNLLFPFLSPLLPHPVVLMEPKTSLLKPSTKPNPPKAA